MRNFSVRHLFFPIFTAVLLCLRAAPAAAQDDSKTDISTTEEIDSTSETKTTSPEKLSSEDREKNFHAQTPVQLADKLRLGLGVGFGTGFSGSNSNYSSDRIGFHLVTLFTVAALSDDLHVLIEGRYSTFSGIDTSTDISSSCQYWLIGGGADFYPMPTRKLRFIGTGTLGISKTAGLRLTNGTRVASKYGSSIGVQGRAIYNVWKKAEIFSGVGLQYGSYSWIDFQVGLLGVF